MDNLGKLRGEFNKRKLKPYRTENAPKRHKTYNNGVRSGETGEDQTTMRNGQEQTEHLSIIR